MMMEWLSDTLVMTTVLMLLVLIMRKPVAAKFGPSVAYWLWLLPAARLFMPALEKTVKAPVIAAPTPEPLAGATSLLAEAQNAAISSPVAANVDWTGLALSVWLGGAALLFIIQMIRYSDMRDELLSDAEDLGEVGGVRLISSDRVAGPLAFGLFRRFIVVPENFASHFTEEESALAIEHELSHHKSGDLFVNLAAFAVLCANWFNPVAWMAWHAFRLDQEAACDARVLSGKDAECRHTYGRTLARATQEGMPTFATALNSPKTIIERLRRLAMNNDSNKRRIVGRLGIFAAIGIALPMTATVVPVWAHPEKAVKAKKEKNITKKVRIIKTGGSGDGDVEVIDDKDLIVKKIEKDGKKIIIKTNKAIDEKEIERLVEKAEKLAKDAEDGRVNADKARERAVEIRIEADKISSRVRKQVEDLRIDGQRVFVSTADGGYPRSFKMHGKFDIAGIRAEALSRAMAQIPEINISEFKGKCRDKRHKHRNVTSSFSAHNGKNKSTVTVKICGKQAAAARAEALSSLQDAREGLRDDDTLPTKLRGEVLEKIEGNIRRLEKDIAADDWVA